MKVTSCDLKLSENSVSAHLSLFIVEPRKERVALWDFPWSVGTVAAAAEVSYRAHTRNESEAVRPTLANESPNRVDWLMCCECECGCVCACV